MNSNQIIFSVIIPTFKDWKRLQLCLEALIHQSLDKKYYEVLIVNNDPEDEFPDGFSFPENSHLLHQPVPGSYAARNLGVENAKGRILAFTDSDCIPHNDWLTNAYEYFKNEEAQRLGGRITLFFNDESHKTKAELYESVFAFDQKGNVTNKEFSVTANLFVDKSCFLETGYFDAAKFSGEDHRWNKRASRLNYTITYADDVVVKHPARQKLTSLVKKKKRVVGGYKRPQKAGRKFIYFGYIIKKYLLGFMCITMAKNDFSIREKMQVIGVVMVLFSVHITEYTHLILGGKPENQ